MLKKVLTRVLGNSKEDDRSIKVVTSREKERERESERERDR